MMVSVVELAERQNWLCIYCQRQMTRPRGKPPNGTDMTREHRHQRSRGGEYANGNMAAACADCNQLKGNLTEWEFANAVMICEEMNIVAKRFIPNGGYMPLKHLLRDLGISFQGGDVRS